jgi:hypothetical protein
LLLIMRTGPLAQLHITADHGDDADDDDDRKETPELVRPWQLADFYRPAGLVYRVADQERPCLIDAVGVHPNEARDMARDRSGCAVFSRANTVAYGTTTLKEPAPLQPVEVRPPGTLVSDSVVVHEKNIPRHDSLPRSSDSAVQNFF